VCRASPCRVSLTIATSADEARIFKNDKHTGPVRGLDFNPIQKNLMLSGAINAEVSDNPVSDRY